MRVIGITGGVGSGKSEILRLLKEEFGAKLLMADDIAHEVMAPGGEASRRIEEAFGADYLKPDKSVDRQKMAELIFKDADALETMNSIVHPAVWRRIEEGIRTAPESWWQWRPLCLTRNITGCLTKCGTSIPRRRTGSAA